MNKDQAQRIIKDTFENKFDKARFTGFIVELLNLKSLAVSDPGVTFNKNSVPTAYQPFINSFEKIADYRSGEHKLDVLIIRLSRETSIERARTMQRNFIAWYLRGDCDGEMKDTALAAFVSPDEEDWRFSLIKMDYSLGEDKRGRVKISEEFTPAKRWSFLVGSNERSHTAQSQLIEILSKDEINPTLTQLEGAFNVEKVTKEFFEKYRELFFQTKETLDEVLAKDSKVRSDFENKNINTIDFSKKLLGQIVFLYFLQKKGWFGVARDADWGTGPKNFLRELFEGKHAKYINFFNDILEPLFYNALRIDRSANDDYHDKFNCKIPFLNGGLFDPINDYDWVHTDINLPNELFSNLNKTKEGDTGSGILDIFDRYNFTVKEDEPLEKEVAVDPEMLGKVFENLLEVKDRKSKGTYYTPREIVHYMYQQSLINYLATELEEKVQKDDIEKLIKYGEQFGENNINLEDNLRDMPESIAQNAKSIDEKLEEIKVCDPAVGSGAFLVAIMGEIVRSRNVLLNYIKNSNRTIYNFKRDCIEKSLYGVDIDPGAVEIAKLRLWLSLVVDEEDIKQIKPLPNLDYKIICGNSLLSVNRQNLFVDYNLRQIEKLKEELFNETNIRKKQEYKEQIDKLITEVTDNNKAFDFEVYFSEVFEDKNEKDKGFDIVIANPPYIGEKGHKELFHEVKKYRLGRFYIGKMDYFYFFFHLALDIGKGNSQIAFITTNYYITALGAKKLRQDFKERAAIRHLINFNELKIFGSAQGQHNMVTILTKANNQAITTQNCITKRAGKADPHILQNILRWKDTQTDYFQVAQKDLYDGEECYIRFSGDKNFIDNPIQIMLERVRKMGVPLVNICNVNNGIFAGADTLSQSKKEKYNINNANVGDGIFILKKQEVDNLSPNASEKLIIKPLFKNSDINKYFTNNINNLFIINLRYTDRPQIDNYPNIKKHLLKFKNLLSDRPKTGTLESAFQNGYWYVMSTSRRVAMDSKKIVAPQRSPLNTFGYNEIPWYAMSDVFFITEKDKSVSLKYVLALINSKLYYLWLYHRGKRKGEILELIGNPLSEIPIKKISEGEQKQFIDLVDRIIALNKSNLETYKKQAQELESQIDQLVYKLYGLTPEEIEIVENSSK